MGRNCKVTLKTFFIIGVYTLYKEAETENRAYLEKLFYLKYLSLLIRELNHNLKVIYKTYLPSHSI